MHILAQLVVSSLCLPFAYLKLVAHSAAAVNRHRGRVRCHMVLRLLTYLFFGLPVLAGRLVVDIFFLIWDDFKLTPIK